MVTIDTVRQLALSFAEAEEQAHFDKPSFRIRNKIFATLWVNEQRAMVKLPLVEQSVFCSYGNDVFVPVPGTWGRQGATFVDLKKVRKDMMKDALTVAYCGIAPKKLAEQYLTE